MTVAHTGYERNPAVQQPSEKTSQLIEIIGTGDMYVLTDRDFITLSNLVDTEDNDGNIVSYRSVVSDPTRGSNNLARYSGQTNQNQVGMLSLGAYYSILLISG